MSLPSFDEHYYQGELLPELSQPIKPEPAEQEPQKVKCLNCPLQLFVTEEAGINRANNDEPSAKAWETFGNNILQKCNIGTPNINTKRRFVVAGEKQVVIRCSSTASKNHQSKLRKMVLPAKPLD